MNTIEWSDEQKFVLGASGRLLVSASAGSGKTAVVVEKVMRLIKGEDAEGVCHPEKSVDLKRILLMTFSRPAAAEMKEKIVKRMYEEIGNPSVRAQLASLPFAHIETIHGFCYYLMRKYFNVVGCDPSVTVGDEKIMEKALDDCIDKVMEGYLKKEDGEFLRLANLFVQNRKYDKFKEYVKKIVYFASTKKDKYEFYELCANYDREALEGYYLKHGKLIIPYIINKTEDYLRWGEEYFPGGTKALYVRTAEVLTEALKTDKAGKFFSVLSELFFDKNPYVKKGPANVGNKNYDPDFAEETGEINGVIKGFIDNIKKDKELFDKPVTPDVAKKKMTEVCLAVEEEYAGYKKRRKTIDVQDAVYFALKILEDGKTREEIGRSFDYIFVDEYQDTDYMQEDLIEGLDSGNVFLVGDVKQAIYHFRSSEPEIFINRKNRYETMRDGTSAPLNTNYRSDKEILDFTNRVCDRVIVKEFCGIDYKNSSELVYGKKVKTEGDIPVVQVYTYTEEKEEESLSAGVYSVADAPCEEKTDTEGEFLARKILSFVGNAEIPDKNGKQRKVGFGDVAVLLRKGKKTMPLVVNALEKYGIPYYTIKETDTAFPERDLLVDTVRVALNASDDYAMLNVTLSPIGGFSAAELVELRAKDVDGYKKTSLWNTLNAYKGDPKLEEKAKILVDFLDELRIKSSYMTAEELLEEVLAKDYDSYLLGKNADTLRNLNAFVAYVGTLPANSSADEFIYYYDNAFKGNKPPAKKNAVVVMTMHGSKGLQFPVVFLPYQNASGSKPDFKEKVFLESDLGLSIKEFDEEEKTADDTFETAVFKMKKTDEERQEEARLMYVAFTRAMHYLVVSGKDEKVPDNVFEGASVMQWIKFAAVSDEKLRLLIGGIELTEREKPEEEAVIKKPFDGSKLSCVYPYEEETVLPVKYTVSEILRKEENAGYDPFAGEPSSAALGTAVHVVMQHVDYSLKTEGEIRESVKIMRENGLLTEEEELLVPVDKILSTLSSGIIKEAAKYRCVREQPFMMYVSPKEGVKDKVLVQGVIDLLIDEGDGYVVVDFKTGKGDARSLKERYARQLELYAEGVEKILKKPVVRKVIYSVMRDFTVEI